MNSNFHSGTSRLLATSSYPHPVMASPSTPSSKLYNMIVYMVNTREDEIMSFLDRQGVGASNDGDENVARCLAVIKKEPDLLTDLIKLHPDKKLFDPSEHKKNCGCKACEGAKKKLWQKTWFTPSLLLIIIILSTLNLFKS